MQLKLTVSHWSFTFISGFVPPFTPFPGFWSQDLFLRMDKREERLDLCNLCDRKSIRDTCTGKILSNLWLSQDLLKPWHWWPEQNFNLLSAEKRYFLAPKSSSRIEFKYKLTFPPEVEKHRFDFIASLLSIYDQVVSGVKRFNHSIMLFLLPNNWLLTFPRESLKDPWWA